MTAQEYFMLNRRPTGWARDPMLTEEDFYDFVKEQTTSKPEVIKLLEQLIREEWNLSAPGKNAILNFINKLNEG